MTDDPTVLTATRPAPWGLLGSITWASAGIVAWFMAQFAVVLVYMAWIGPGADIKQLATNGFLLALATVLAGPIWIGVMAVAARWRGWSARDYLALTMPKRSEVLVGLACLAPLLLAFDLLGLTLGRDVVPPFMRDSYISAQASGTLAVTSALWAAMHIQYDTIITTQIFLIGLILGWLRWASGSTLLTIILHMMTNLAATVQAAIKVEWLS